MSQKSIEIGQCSICLSNLNISYIYAISKCGHTFHQKCIHQWISNAKNCPTCRTNACQSDIIKLFIQENNNEFLIPKKEESLPYIETKLDDCFRRIMKECKCAIFQYESGDLQYIYEKSIVEPNGIRYEQFYQGMRNGIKEFLVKTQREGSFRSDEDFVRQNTNFIKFCFPKFTIKRSLKNGDNGKVTIRVYTNGSNKSLKIQICSEHQSFYVEHLFEEKITRCTNPEFLCDHLQE
uniref:RING-type domain-containing protein n=1 Tax=Panagrolaimus davidi TaxID=227884 RepID=A0A914QJ67_9BILA